MKRAALVLGLGWGLTALALGVDELPPTTTSAPAEAEAEDVMSAGTFAGLKFRALGPALMSGRISDVVVSPAHPAHWYVAAASGGVWKTVNAGTTWTPIFDDQGSYSIGCLALDPHNPHVLWVGTGENNSQRSVGFGDGVYRTRDGGLSWEHLGLKESEHIGMIAIDPRDSDIVYVAAQGPLWRAGGDRGLYKTTDGGASWQRILHISDDTGINEVHLDPRDPDIVYCSSYQRRRHVWTLINGGPEGAVHKSTDGGATWRKINQGLPSVDLGRIGLEIAPSHPDVLYAIVEAANDEHGVFCSTNRGESWEKRSDHRTTSAQYYNEIFCDPHDPDHIYALNTVTHESRDGGRSWQALPRENRHVDDHALWIDPTHTDHLLIGSDGGLYESWTHGREWRYFDNLPITQFYRVAVDNDAPFYNIYGGTQDNNTQGGPTRTLDRMGIGNEHWFITVGGDGYETAVDPTDPNIVYSLWQYGGLVRFDRRSGQVVDIKPREAPGEPPYRWNWDTPLLLSPHDHRRLYVAANKVFRSDDRGQSWTTISPDLTRQLDRNQLEIMGRIQPPDAVSKHHATSFYGNIVALDESPLRAGLLYVGTDDGLIHVSENGGTDWRKIDSFPGVPDRTYVSCLRASSHAVDSVFATFDNHKQGDFKPYVLCSRDRGQSWESIAGDLPEREVVYTLVQDHVKPELLFVGTEFGVYGTLDGGTQWIRLKGGIPTIAVRDLDIQRRENDLVAGTFGRGFYILDDYTPLRHITRAQLEDEVLLLPVRESWQYIERSRLHGANGRGSQGAAFFAAPNPPFGAVFTYYLPEKIETDKERRQRAESEAIKAEQAWEYPPFRQLLAETRQQDPKVILTVHDAEGAVVRRLEGPRDKGFHRVAWNLRYPAATPISLDPLNPDAPAGPLALPGTYTVTLGREVDGTLTPLAGPVSFEVVPLELATFAAADRAAVLAFRQKVARLRRAVFGTIRAVQEAEQRILHVQAALRATPGADPARLAEVEALRQRVLALLEALRGDPAYEHREEPASPTIQQRVEQIVSAQWNATQPPTQTQQDAYRYAGAALAEVLGVLRNRVHDNLLRLEEHLETVGAPWTPGRIPEWQLEE